MEPLKYILALRVRAEIMHEGYVFVWITGYVHCGVGFEDVDWGEIGDFGVFCGWLLCWDEDGSARAYEVRRVEGVSERGVEIEFALLGKELASNRQVKVRIYFLLVSSRRRPYPNRLLRVAFHRLAVGAVILTDQVSGFDILLNGSLLKLPIILGRLPLTNMLRHVHPLRLLDKEGRFVMVLLEFGFGLGHAWYVVYAFFGADTV